MSSEAEIQCSKQNLEYEMIEYLVLQMKRLLTLLVAAMMLLLVASTGFAQSSAEGEAATETESQALDEDELLSNEEIEQLSRYCKHVHIDVERSNPVEEDRSGPAAAAAVLRNAEIALLTARPQQADLCDLHTGFCS